MLKKYVISTPNLTDIKREEILCYFRLTYELYEKLFEVLVSDEVFYHRPEPLRHPIIFYFGHTASFFINKLVVGKFLKERINPHLESMFAIGVDEMSWDDLDEKRYEWPSVEETRAYRNSVRQTVEQFIQTMPLTLPISWESPFWVIMMGIEHERIHIETTSVLIRQLHISSVRAHELWSICHQSSGDPQNELLKVQGASVTMGRGSDDTYYGWDNEYGTKTVQVGDFEASRYLVSNGEFLRFVQEGGYQNHSWWEEEGSQWLEYKKPTHPTFWVPDVSGGYRYRAICEEIALPLDWPVDVNYHEAKAFCNYLGVRLEKKLCLPSEAQWYRLLEYSEAAALDANIELKHFASSCPVTMFKHGDFYDVRGNVWQWCETSIDGFDGFKIHPLYDDFSVPTFDGRHNMIKGGSWISTGNEALVSARFAFRRHFFQHAGFRYVVSGEEQTQTLKNSYETDKAVSQYLEFHYGKQRLGVENFPAKCVQIALDFMVNKPKRHALEIGCAVGRASFELAEKFERVTGLDFSTRFILRAVELAKNGETRYEFCEQGDIYGLHTASLEQFGLDKTAARVEFLQADACNLKPIFKGYDLILALNLIDRLYDPQKFLRDTAWRINSGGLLVLSSPYSWDEAYTPREKWLGGFMHDGDAVDSFESIKVALEADFRLLHTQDVPFVLAESDRKHQHTVSHLSVWERI